MALLLIRPTVGSLVIGFVSEVGGSVFRCVGGIAEGDNQSMMKSLT